MPFRVVLRVLTGPVVRAVAGEPDIDRQGSGRLSEGRGPWTHH